MVVDEQLPVICNENGPAQYHCYLFGNGVVRTGQQFPLNIETERNIASAPRCFCSYVFSNLMHVHGHLLDFQSTTAQPTSMLRDPSNWSLAYCEPRLIPLA